MTRHRRLVMRALRAVGTVLRTSARLDRDEVARLHAVGRMMLARDLLRPKEQRQERRVVNLADFSGGPIFSNHVALSLQLSAQLSASLEASSHGEARGCKLPAG